MTVIGLKIFVLFLVPYHPEDDNHDDKDCDPYDEKPCKGGNQRCHDDDGDGHFKCECEFNFFIKDVNDGNCVLGRLK